MKHDILGEITHTEGDVFDGVSTVRFGSHDVKIQMCRHDHPFEVTLKLASAFVQDLPELDRRAKQIAVANLRESYNNGWNEYDETQEDGSMKAVSNPELSEAEFEAKLSLRTANVLGDRIIELSYDSEGMFWGHSVVVISESGTDFSEAHAELIG